ncbi:hypothetical protein B9Z55_012111 [Caenorhabditis nigoni]|uniref:SCP domain-containing protein n=1 Tax=Caenorhabditis nigoni TaxID=1611254 RepID=A0A2G5TVP9_9PELO|nr:hypothetical protein B9Z55_012111 [Caenorhabditis nigoni]
MKGHFSIGILLLICVQWTVSASIPVKRGLDDDGRAILSEINNERKTYAEKEQIANMHELVYDDSLEKRIEQWTCTSPTPDVMFVLLPPEWELLIIKDQIENGKSDELPEKTAEFVRVALNPLQTNVGCADIKLDCAQLRYYGVACLVGPKSSISKSDYIRGPPGSRCPNGNGSNGLCKSKGNAKDNKHEFSSVNPANESIKHESSKSSSAMITFLPIFSLIAFSALF